MVNRAENLADWPIAKPVTNAGERAAELHAAWAEQHARIATVEREHAAARATLRETTEKLRDAHYEANRTAKGGGKAIAEAEAAYTKAEEEANAPWAYRLEAPVRAAEDARGAYESHISDNLDELLSEPELADAAQAARDAIVETTRAQTEACEEWRRVNDAHGAILRYADGINGRALPELEGAARELYSAGERLLMAEDGPGRLVAPCVPKRDLDNRRVQRGEAELVEVDGPNGKGVQVVNR